MGNLLIQILLACDRAKVIPTPYSILDLPAIKAGSQLKPYSYALLNYSLLKCSYKIEDFIRAFLKATVPHMQQKFNTDYSDSFSVFYNKL